MSAKSVLRAVNRMRRGVTFFARNTSRPGPSTFLLHTVPSSVDGTPAWRGVVLNANGKIVEVWESASLDTLRRIATGYYSGLSKCFGPARNYVGR